MSDGPSYDAHDRQANKMNLIAVRRDKFGVIAQATFSAMGYCRGARLLVHCGRNDLRCQSAAPVSAVGPITGVIPPQQFACVGGARPP